MGEFWIKIKQYFTEDKRTFASGTGFKKMFLIFSLFSIFGAYYEQILNFCKAYVLNGSIFWQRRSGVFYGPFSPVYGLGAVLIIYLLGRKKYSDGKIFCYGALLGGALEYSISYLQEVFTHTVSWDYSHHFLNIQGRTTIPFMLFWGLLSFILVKWVYPFLSQMIEAIPNRLGNFFYVSLVIFLSFDMLISWSALIRGTLRQENHPPISSVGKFYDKTFPDSYLQEKFPNMNFQVQKGIQK